MAYWITLKKQKVRRGFSAATAQEAYDVLRAMTEEGWEEVRIIDPAGEEVSAYALQIAVNREVAGCALALRKPEPAT